MVLKNKSTTAGFFRVAALMAILGVVSSTAFGQISKTGTTAAKFLSIPIGARAIAMGGAFVGIADDATSMYWNPAGTARLRQREAVVSHAQWIADIDFNYGGLTIPLGDGTLGFNLTSLSMGEMERTTESQPEGTGETFSAGSFAIGVSYARNLTDWFSIGFTGKYISETIWNSEATGFAVDLGTLFTTPFEGLTFGVGMSNFGQKLRMIGDDLLVQKDISPDAGNNPNINANLTTDRFDLPLTLRLGFSYELLTTESQTLILVTDASYPNDNSESFSLGAEYTLFDRFISFRGGYKSVGMQDGEEEFTFGGGVNYQVVSDLTMKLDYAYMKFGRLKNIHVFTIGILF